MGKLLFLIGALTIIALGFFIYKPQISGNIAKEVQEKVSCNDELQTAKNDLAAAQKELESCNSEKNAAISDMKKMEAPEICDKSQLSELQGKYDDLLKQKSALLKNLKDAQDEAKECSGGNDDFTQLNESLSELAKNSANNICCKQKIDNPNIKAYSVENNKINCLESGDLQLNCP